MEAEKAIDGAKSQSAPSTLEDHLQAINYSLSKEYLACRVTWCIMNVIKHWNCKGMIC